MKPLSASEAVWPALERTWRSLFRPFAWATYLKMASAAVLTEGVLVSFRFTAPSMMPSGDFDFSRLRAIPGFLFYASLAALSALLVFLLLFLLITQLRFAFFHCLLRRTTEIRPAWRLYPIQAQRFFKATLLVWLVLLLILLLAVAALAVTVFVVFTVRTPEGKLDPGVFLILFFPCVGIAVFAAVAALAAEVVLHDFILPTMALEDASFREAWRAVRRRIAAEKETFFSYFVLRLLLQFLAGFLLFVAGLLPGMLAFAILGASAAGFNAMLEDATGILAALRIALQVLFILLGLGVGWMLAAALGGPLAVFLRNLALCFYGSRYQPLGDILGRSADPECAADSSQEPFPARQCPTK
jgi:hypothetical protein